MSIARFHTLIIPRDLVHRIAWNAYKKGVRDARTHSELFYNERDPDKFDKRGVIKNADATIHRHEGWEEQ